VKEICGDSLVSKVWKDVRIMQQSKAKGKPSFV